MVRDSVSNAGRCSTEKVDVDGVKVSKTVITVITNTGPPDRIYRKRLRQCAAVDTTGRYAFPALTDLTLQIFRPKITQHVARC
jgi:hypothetical protein